MGKNIFNHVLIIPLCLKQNISVQILISCRLFQTLTYLDFTVLMCQKEMLWGNGVKKKIREYNLTRREDLPSLTFKQNMECEHMQQAGNSSHRARLDLGELMPPSVSIISTLWKRDNVQSCKDQLGFLRQEGQRLYSETGVFRGMCWETDRCGNCSQGHSLQVLL